MASTVSAAVIRLLKRLAKEAVLRDHAWSEYEGRTEFSLCQCAIGGLEDGESEKAVGLIGGGQTETSDGHDQATAENRPAYKHRVT